MKLNPDCIRGILLTVEEKCNFDTPWEYDRDTFESEYLAEFSHEEIVYHLCRGTEPDCRIDSGGHGRRDPGGPSVLPHIGDPERGWK